MAKYGNVWESMGKLWESIGKLWESMGSYGKLRENMEMYVKVW